MSFREYLDNHVKKVFVSICTMKEWEKAIRKKLPYILSADRVKTRVQAVRKLGEMGNKRAIPALQ